jgi:acetyltransferase-like isoleucine patch superfamily enzyme
VDLDKLNLPDDEDTLLKELRKLREDLDAKTLDEYGRLNPFGENITDWHARGDKYASEGSVVYDSATLIGDIEMGPDLWIGPFCMIDGSGGLKIGAHCVFSTGVHVYTHDSVKYALTGGKAGHDRSPVEIGECTFIGAQSVVTRGVKIGDHVLVCANATITEDVPAWSIVGGTPAKVIGRVVPDGDDVRLEYFHGASPEQAEGQGTDGSSSSSSDDLGNGQTL